MKSILLIITQIALSTMSWAQTVQHPGPTTDFSEMNRKVLSLFDTYPLVAIGEGFHNSALTAEWLNTMIYEDDFPEKVRNIVVEFGASEYQSVMDDFTQGKEVPDSLFKKCWRETTQLFVWDNPIYEAFFREMRKVNARLPVEKRIRVLLGDPAFGSMESGDEHVFAIIEKEVLAKNQTALLLYGDLHFVRRDFYFNYASGDALDARDRNLVQFLEMKYPGKTFSIWGSVNTNDPATLKILEEEQITMPDLVITAESGLGALDFLTFYPYPSVRVDAAGNDIDTAQYVEKPIKEIADGILFRGTWEDQVQRLAPRPDEIYADTVYLNQLIKKARETKQFYRVQRFEYFKLRWSPEYEPLLSTLEGMDADRIDQAFQAIKRKYSDFRWMQVLNILGYELLAKKETSKAIAVFELATREYPDVSNLYNSLGEAYLTAGEKAKAIASFTRSLQIDPGNQASRNKLDALNGN